MTEGKSRTIRLRPRVQRDLDEIAERFPQIAEQIIKKIEILYDYPRLGSAMDGAFQGYRQLLAGKYRIIYQIVTETEIEIAYIRHGARQLGLRVGRPNWLETLSQFLDLQVFG